ncbi:hypothetical protein F5Y15DRAFT_429697 [Xylariaceae sp. FL0016]|nr:hypothetical protein F5Y15DRAFT_429697 [Xylariaceae sp. FL0016]
MDDVSMLDVSQFSPRSDPGIPPPLATTGTCNAGGWGQYASSTTGFGALCESDGNKLLADAPKGPSSSRPFGNPSPYKFFTAGNLVWTRPKSPTPIPERSLEDLYIENPKMGLNGMDPDTLKLAAEAILQVINEATKEWLEVFCPDIPFNEVFDVIRAAGMEGHHTASIYVVPSSALNLPNADTTLAQLFRHCHRARPASSEYQVADLLRILDRSILLCRVLKDQKRCVLLHKTKDIIQWLPVGLDAKKLQIQRFAAMQLSNINKRFEDPAKPVSDGQTRGNEEVKLLQVAQDYFETYRADFKMELLIAIKVLLASTGIFNEGKGSEVPKAPRSVKGQPRTVIVIDDSD